MLMSIGNTFSEQLRVWGQFNFNSITQGRVLNKVLVFYAYFVLYLLPFRVEGTNFLRAIGFRGQISLEARAVALSE